MMYKVFMPHLRREMKVSPQMIDQITSNKDNRLATPSQWKPGCLSSDFLGAVFEESKRIGLAASSAADIRSAMMAYDGI